MKITITDATELEYQQFWSALLAGISALNDKRKDFEKYPEDNEIDHAALAAKHAMVLREAFESTDVLACVGNVGRVKR